jgi:opacity protein-like surface antigen
MIQVIFKICFFYIYFLCLELFFFYNSVLAEGTFYVSPKVIYGKQKINMEPASSWLEQGRAKEYMQPHATRYSGISQPVIGKRFYTPSFSSQNPFTFGAVSLGVDFFSRFNIPIRLEIEISTTSDFKSNKGLNKTTYYTENAIVNNTPTDIKFHGYLSNYQVSYNINTVFFNTFVDWHNNTKFIPYIGSGIGLTFIEAKVSYSGNFQGISAEYDRDDNMLGAGYGGKSGHYAKKANDKLLTWHVDMGISYNLTDNFAIDLAYRYIHYSNAFSMEKHKNIDYAPDYAYSHSVGPKKINIESVNQIVFGFRYSFY